MIQDIDLFFSENPVSDSTRRTYAWVLLRFVSAVSVETCTASDVRDWLDSTGWGASLRYVAAVAVRGFIRWRYGSHHPAARIRVKRRPARPGRVLGESQVMTLLASFNTATAKGARDLAICALALDTGLRVGELAALRAADVDLSGCRLQVVVKGGRWAVAVFSPVTAAYLARWDDLRRAGDDRFFQVSRDGLRVIVRRWGERCGFRLSPHDLRRTFAVMALRAGAPSRVVQVAGRWSSLAMVERYSQAITPADFAGYFPVERLLDS